MYRTFHPKVAEHILFSRAYGTFFKMYHMLGHKTSLSILKKTEIISSIISNNSSMKLELNYRNKTGKIINMWKLNVLLDNQLAIKEVKREMKKYLETNEYRNEAYQGHLVAQSVKHLPLAQVMILGS